MSLESLRRHRLLIWVCGIVMLLSALAPTVSRALAGAAQGNWALVCSVGGVQWVEIGADAPAADAVVLHAPDGAGPAHAELDHCPLCALMADRLAVPSPAAHTHFAALPAGELPAQWQDIPALPAHTIVSASPRGPPASPALC